MKKALAFALVAVLGFCVCKLENSKVSSNSLVSKLSLKSFNNFKNRGRL